MKAKGQQRLTVNKTPAGQSSCTTDVTQHFRITTTKRMRTTNEQTEFMKQLNERVKTIQCTPQRRMSYQSSLGKQFPRVSGSVERTPNASPNVRQSGIPQQDNIRLNFLLSRFTKMFQPKNCSLSTSEKAAEQRFTKQSNHHIDKRLQPIQQLSSPYDESAFYRTVLEREERENSQKRRLLNSIERQQRKRVKIIFTKKRLSKMRGQLQINLENYLPNP